MDDKEMRQSIGYMRKQLGALDDIVRSVRRLMKECPLHNADEVPDWLDYKLADLSAALSGYDRAKRGG